MTQPSARPRRLPQRRRAPARRPRRRLRAARLHAARSGRDHRDRRVLARHAALNAHAIIGHCLAWIEASAGSATSTARRTAPLGARPRGHRVRRLRGLQAARGDGVGDRAQADEGDLADTYRALVDRVAAAQEPDGYLHTLSGAPASARASRDLEWGHEMYCFGHLLQAAVARLRSGHDDELPAVARRVADMPVASSAPNGRAAVGGHPEIEVALAEFGRATGDARVHRARGDCSWSAAARVAERPSSTAPSTSRTTSRCATQRCCAATPCAPCTSSAGAIDVGVESDDDALVGAVAAQYLATLARRTYITGGMGSHHRDEAFGDGLRTSPRPRVRRDVRGDRLGHGELAALARSGEARYGDVIERTLLNAVLSCPRERRQGVLLLQHVAPAHARATSRRMTPRARVRSRACARRGSRCRAAPPTWPARSLRAALVLRDTRRRRGSRSTSTATSPRPPGGWRGTSVAIASAYPFEGEVGSPSLPRPLSPSRSPCACPHGAEAAATWAVDGDGLRPPSTTATSASTGIVDAGHRIALSLPMSRRASSIPDPQIDDVRGQVAIERGPLVLALESSTFPTALDTESVEIDLGLPHRVDSHRERASPCDTARASERPLAVRGRHPAETDRSQAIVTDLIPYARWANRGPSTMRVFLPQAQS